MPTVCRGVAAAAGLAASKRGISRVADMMGVNCPICVSCRRLLSASSFTRISLSRVCDFVVSVFCCVSCAARVGTEYCDERTDEEHASSLCYSMCVYVCVYVSKSPATRAKTVPMVV